MNKQKENTRIEMERGNRHVPNLPFAPIQKDEPRLILQSPAGFSSISEIPQQAKIINRPYKNQYDLRKISKELLKKENYTCKCCGGEATEVHHLDLSRNNHSIKNLIVLCRPCHQKYYHSKNNRKYQKIKDHNLPKYSEIASRVPCCELSIYKYFKNDPTLTPTLWIRIKEAIEELQSTHTPQITPNLIQRNHKHQRQIQGINSL